jgi:hypothetical protein
MLSKIYVLLCVREGGQKARQESRPPLGGRTVAGSTSRTPSQASKCCGRAFQPSPQSTPHPVRKPLTFQVALPLPLSPSAPEGSSRSPQTQVPTKGPPPPPQGQRITRWSTTACAIVMAKNPQPKQSTVRRPSQSPAHLSNPCGSLERKHCVVVVQEVEQVQQESR